MAIRELTIRLTRRSAGALIALCVFAAPLVHAEPMFPGVSWSTPERPEQPSGWSQEKLKLAAVFVLSLLGLSLLTFGLSRMLGLELTFP